MFHVPERSRITTHPQLGTDATWGNHGAFDLESVEPGWRLMLICSDDDHCAELGMPPWQHVSVHAYNASGRTRTPSWKEMCFVKGLCWDDEDVVMQLHPRRSEYVNHHPHTLHLWRPTDCAIPTPPSQMVGPKSNAA